MSKKAVLNTVFISILAFTLILWLVFLRDADINFESNFVFDRNGVLTIVTFLFIPPVIAELELWYDTGYFVLCTEKSKLKTVFCVICALLAFVSLVFSLAPFIGGRLFYMLGIHYDTSYFTTACYLALRMIYGVIYGMGYVIRSIRKGEEE